MHARASSRSRASVFHDDEPPPRRGARGARHARAPVHLRRARGRRSSNPEPRARRRGHRGPRRARSTRASARGHPAHRRAASARRRKGQILIVNADAVARELALRDSSRTRSSTSTRRAACSTSAASSLRGEPRRGLRRAHRRALARPASRGASSSRSSTLLELPPTSSVSITSPDHLAKELFTHRGDRARSCGAARSVHLPRGLGAHRHDAPARAARGVLRPRARRRLLRQEGALPHLPRRVVPRDRDPHATRHGVPYLDKFAVTTRRRARAIGGSIWQRMRRENPKLFWRARDGNAINPWYSQQPTASTRTSAGRCSGAASQGFDEIQRCVEHALAMPATFHDRTGAAAGLSGDDREARASALVGARGYVGRELVRLLRRHPRFEVALRRPRARSPRRARTRGCDLALRRSRRRGRRGEARSTPTCSRSRTARAAGTSRRSTRARPDAVIVDLSAPTIASTTRGSTASPSAIARQIRGARRIANPGCYATGDAARARAPALPLVERPAQRVRRERLQRRRHDAVAENNPEALRDNLMPYSLVGHVHEREVARQLGRRCSSCRTSRRSSAGSPVTVSVALARAAHARRRCAGCYRARPTRGEPLGRRHRRDPARPRHRRPAVASTIGGFTRRRGRAPRRRRRHDRQPAQGRRDARRCRTSTWRSASPSSWGSIHGRV